MGTLADEALAAQLGGHRQVLCMVNSRKAAQQIFARLPKEGSYHLSTLMTPAHRQALLREIRQRLRDGETCRVVSTSLIEAGVDVDFPAVYREMAGLDSILQAAGRCNREGKRRPEESVVTIFERTELAAVAVPADGGRGPDGSGEGHWTPVRRRPWRSISASSADLSGEALDKCSVIQAALTEGNEGCELPFRNGVGDASA